MTSSEQFEAKCRNGLINGGLAKHENGKYASELTDAVWRGWQASRAVVEVELPEEMTWREAAEQGLPTDYSNGFTDAVIKCYSAVRSAGIKVKGE
ncbi:hypothetical protein [Hafnia alvei]|uniref:hypothetical protein n=1 Tax=Hafnia alvei TaxID=569 RepID=UPI0021F478CB|nr:hypothetical protein [Hafnia alvei]MCV9377326.1 hypothetical protein [Hafnia alvei]